MPIIVVACFQGGEPDLMTAAKMILHDWQRGKIPFFVPPPQQEGDSSVNSDAPETTSRSDAPEGSADPTISADRTTAAMKAIAGIISSQQQMLVPSHKGLFGDELENEKLEETLEDDSDQKC